MVSVLYAFQPKVMLQDHEYRILCFAETDEHSSLFVFVLKYDLFGY